MASVQYMALRDGDGCQKCGTTENLTRDHIWPRSQGGCNCDGNFQILCADCNLAKADTNDGRGHKKADCPRLDLQRFMSKWRTGQREFTRKQILALVPELEGIRDRLSAFRCNPYDIKKAHSMIGSVKAYHRDFKMIRAQLADEKPITLERLRKTEEKLVEKLGYVREQIAELEGGG